MSRFSRLTRKLQAKGIRDPAGLAADIGRRKYGEAGFEALAEKGRRKKGRRGKKRRSR